MSAPDGRRIAAMAVLAAAAIAAHLYVVRPWFSTWGASEQEVAAVWPGDELSPAANTVMTRAVTIRAPAADVWPWVAQVGQDRAGWYSYRLLENIVGCRMPRLDLLVPQFQTRAPGDKVWMYPADRIGGAGHAILARVEPPRAFVMRTAEVGSAPTVTGTGNSWSAILEPVDAHTTRLIMRSRGTSADSWIGKAFGTLVFDPIHFVMERKMMTTLADLSEGRRPPELPDLIQVGLWLALGILGIAAAVRVLFSNEWVEPLLVMAAVAVVLPISMLLQPNPLVTALFYVGAGAMPLLWKNVTLRKVR
jgi:hypothetical protein